MAQHDMNIANQGFPAFRADLNSALTAIANNSSGATEPGTTFAYQWWYDTSTNVLKMRNADNDAWISIGTFNQTTDSFTPSGVTSDKIEEGNSSVEVVDSGTGYVIVVVDGAEAARVDSSRNLLVGTTDGFATISTTSTESGHVFNATGGYAAARAGAPIYANRTGSDGDIAVFRRDGSTVGSIGGYGGGNLLLTHSSGGLFLGSNMIAPCQTDGTPKDNAIALGSAPRRFKDLYLSGGVYLGGTGSANYLDDYEEGTWTPAIRVEGEVSDATVSISNATYVKIGKIVHCQFSLSITSIANQASNKALELRGLPFNPEQYGLSGNVQATGLNGAVDKGLELASINQAYLRIVEFTGTTITNSSNHFVNGTSIRCGFTYEVA
jgi:hypothetical protein